MYYFLKIKSIVPKNIINNKQDTYYSTNVEILDIIFPEKNSTDRYIQNMNFRSYGWSFLLKRDLIIKEVDNDNFSYTETIIFNYEFFYTAADARFMFYQYLKSLLYIELRDKKIVNYLT